MSDLKDTPMTAPPLASPWSSRTRPESDPAPQGAFVHVVAPKDAQADWRESLDMTVWNSLEADWKQQLAVEKNTER